MKIKNTLLLLLLLHRALLWWPSVRGYIFSTTRCSKAIPSRFQTQRYYTIKKREMLQQCFHFLNYD